MSITLLLAPLIFQVFLRHCTSSIWLRWLDECITLVHINWKKHYLSTLCMYINNTFRHKNNNKSVAVKGHLISKCLLGFFNFLQKTSENKSTWVYIVVEENSFDCFLEEMSARKNNFDFFRPLSKRKLVRRVTENKWKIVIQCGALRKKEDLPQGVWAEPRTTDTQWRHKSEKPEILGRCGRQNMLRPYL